MLYQITVIIVCYILFEKTTDYWFESLNAKSFTLAPSSGHNAVQSPSEIKTSPYLLCFAVEPLNSLPLQSKRLFSHQMRQLKARQDSWGTTGRQNTTGSLWQAHK